ncbi:hypothetical protein [Streptomyces sp. NPDC050121]|uniref:hypothetical protein n=1 Tax=Streptomyces sp. NPDC050121 TaxID=3365601 RepID=UPI003788F554
MSRHRVRHLVCDKPLCTARYIHGDGTAPETVLRHHARAAGWKRTKGNRDYCPEHNPWPGFGAWALSKTTGVAR